MRFSLVRRLVVPTTKGNQWKERSAKNLPPGYGSFNYSPWYFINFTGGLFGVVYFLLQIENNPDSIYAKFYNDIWNYVRKDMDECVKYALEHEKAIEEKEKKAKEPSILSNFMVGLNNAYVKATSGAIMYEDEEGVTVNSQ